MIVVDDDDDKVSQNLQECGLFSPDQTRDRGRIGRCNTLVLQNKGLATFIRTIDKDAGGMDLDTKMHLLVGRLRRWDN